MERLTRLYYGYDMLCRLSEIRERDAYIRYQYDDLGMLTEKSFSNEMTTSYEYDARGNVTRYFEQEGKE